MRDLARLKEMLGEGDFWERYEVLELCDLGFLGKILGKGPEDIAFFSWGNPYGNDKSFCLFRDDKQVWPSKPKVDIVTEFVRGGTFMEIMEEHDLCNSEVSNAIRDMLITTMTETGRLK